MTNVSDKPWRDEETLRKKYFEEGMSGPELSDEWGVDSDTIYRWMEKFGLERSQAERGRENKPWRQESVLRELYLEQEMTSYEIGDELGVAGSTVQDWLRKTGIETRHIENRDNHPWRDGELMRELYCDKGMNTYEMADEWNVAPRTVLRWLVRHGIDINGPVHRKMRRRPDDWKKSVDSIREVDHAYMAGLIDGDGSIHTIMQPTDSYSLGYSMKPTMKLEQIKNGNVESMVEDYLDSLGVNYNNNRVEYEGKYPDHYRIQVTGVRDVDVLLTAVRPWLEIKKPQADIVLEEMIPKIESGVHTEKEGFIELMGVVDRLSEMKQGVPRDRKYTEEFFREKWGISG